MFAGHRHKWICGVGSTAVDGVVVQVLHFALGLGNLADLGRQAKHLCQAFLRTVDDSSTRVDCGRHGCILAFKPYLRLEVGRNFCFKCPGACSTLFAIGVHS